MDRLCTQFIYKIPFHYNENEQNDNALGLRCVCIYVIAIKYVMSTHI